MNSEEIWRRPKVLAVTQMGKSWLYAAMQEDKFPRPIRLGARAVGWRKSDIEKWLSERESA